MVIAGCDSGDNVENAALDVSIPGTESHTVGPGSSGTPVSEIEINTGGAPVVSPIDISSTLRHSATLGANPQYYKLKIEPTTSLTVLVRGSGRPRMYLSDQYLISACVVGQSSPTASSCVWSTNEEGEMFFAVSGPAGASSLVEVLIPPDPPPEAPPALQKIDSIPFESRITHGVWMNSQGNFGLDPHYFLIDSLTPGLNYRVLIESPDLDTKSWVGDCIESRSFNPGCDRGIDDVRPSYPCINNNGVYECQQSASQYGELYVAVEPILGAQFAEFTLDLIPLDGVYTGYYEGSGESPVDITGQLPYSGGYEDTFSVSHYLLTGLTPGELYKLSIERNGDFFDSTKIKISDGEPGYSRAFGRADNSGTVALVLNVDRGTFSVSVDPAPIDRGTQSSPVVIDATQEDAFIAEVGTGYSWYRIDNLFPDTDYRISTSDRDVHSIVVHPNYGLNYPASFICGFGATYCVYPSTTDGSILFRIMDNSGAGKIGGEVNISFSQDTL